jgi:hypothetical protein
MAQLVNHQPFTAVAQVCSQASRCGVYGGQIGSGTGFYLNVLVFPSQYHSTSAPYSSSSVTDYILILAIESIIT